MPATTRTSETTQLAARLRLSVMRLARRLRQQAEGDVTPSMLSALASLERVGPSTLGELASLEHVQPPTMTRIVARLGDDGLVKREVDKRDRRVSYVRLSREGRQMLQRNRKRKNLYLAKRLQSLSDEEIVALEEAAEAIENLLEQEDD